MRKAVEQVRNGTGGIRELLWGFLAKLILYCISSKPRSVKAVPFGFDEEDIEMANAAFQRNYKRVASVMEFLAPSPQNQETSYQIGIAFLGGTVDSCLRLGHAEIVILDGDGLTNLRFPNSFDLTLSPPSIDPEELVRASHVPSITDNIRLRVLHIRNARDGDDSLELVLETKKTIQPYRYMDLYRIHMTERQLKHLAMLACPEKYIVLVDDCATFSFHFLKNLLGHLRDRGKHNGGIDRAQYKRQIRLLEKQIHIENGWKGTKEALILPANPSV
ncbi:hypothetical protein M426DRAFT_6668 [Hypoxylon sp. CI-4A]|nr:hypothetical protein M426DRAFT_6668 [Hypoxylon sp. CI-4A]